MQVARSPSINNEGRRLEKTIGKAHMNECEDAGDYHGGVDELALSGGVIGQGANQQRRLQRGEIISV